MPKVVFGLGANLSNPIIELQNAVNHIKQHFFICKVSNIYKSISLLKDEQNDYYNIALLCETNYTPLEIIEITQNIEKLMGRVKVKKWGERIIDIDIIDYDNKIIKYDNLIIPHYHMEERSFVLYPLLDIDKNYIHPVSKLNVNSIISNLKDDFNISLVKNKQITI